MQLSRCFVLLAVKKGKGGAERQKTGNVRVEIFLRSQRREEKATSRVWRDLPRALVCTPVFSLDVARVLKTQSRGPGDGVGGGLNCHKAALLTR